MRNTSDVQSISTAMLEAIYAQENKVVAFENVKTVAQELCDMKLPEAAKKVENSAEETLRYMGFPREH